MHKVKSFQDLGALPGIYTTDTKAEALYQFLCSYQAEHNRQTPSMEAMENELEIPREAVRSLLGRLENRGRIFITSRNPMVVIIKDPDAVEAMVGLAREGAAERFLSVEGIRHKIGRYIGAHELEHGTGPSYSMIKEHCGLHSLAYTHRMCDEMVKRRVITEEVPPRLTKSAREYYGIRPKPVVIYRPTTKGTRTMTSGRKPITERARLLCIVLAEHKRKRGLNFTPRYIDIAPEVGYASKNSAGITYAALSATEQGWLEPKHKGSQGLYFTDKGLAEFMPETVQQAAPIDQPYELTNAASQEPTAATFEVEHDTRVLVERTEPERFDARRSSLEHYATGDLMEELIDRGYTVRKG